MELRKLAIMLAIVSLCFSGVFFAQSQNDTLAIPQCSCGIGHGNATGMAPPHDRPGFDGYISAPRFPPEDGNMSVRPYPQGFMHGNISDENRSVDGFHGCPCRDGNHGFSPRVQLNSTVIDNFKAAMESGDFKTASELHSEYGLGGRIFDKLNETTFKPYSQIYVMVKQLEGLLGMDNDFLLDGMIGGFHPRGPPPNMDVSVSGG